MCGDAGDYEYLSIDKRELRRARKPHRCYGCSETIRPGDRHHVATQLFDGEWSTYRHCLRCDAIMKALWASGAESVEWGLDCGEVWENPPEHVARLAFATADEMQREAS